MVLNYILVGCPWFIDYFINKEFSQLKCLSLLPKRGIFSIQLKLNAHWFLNHIVLILPSKIDLVWLVQLSSVIKLTRSINQTHWKVPVQWCSISKPIEQQSDQLARLHKCILYNNSSLTRALPLLILKTNYRNILLLRSKRRLKCIIY